MRSSKNSKSPSSASPCRSRRLNPRPRAFALITLLSLSAGILSSCEPTYPARTITTQIPKVLKEELKVDATATVAGKTLWIYIPVENVIDEKKMTWNLAGLEVFGKALSVIHRIILSTDAKVDFIVSVAADTKHFGLQFIAIEHVQDLKEAMLEKFSRGEYFQRSVRDVGYNPEGLGDMTGAALKTYDLTFDEFMCLQIIHRLKGRFVKDPTLLKIFEIKSTNYEVKFGILKINVEFLKKRYDLTPEEEKIRPIDIFKMTSAQVIENYRYHDKIQAVELSDTFSGDFVRLTSSEIKQVKINLPQLDD